MNRNKKILIFPYFEKHSPYTQDLENGLQTFFKVCKAKNLFFFPLVRNYLIYKPNTIHFDWFHMYYSNPISLFKTSLKLFMFVFDFFLLKFFNSNIYISLHNLKPHDSRYRKIDFFCYNYVIRLSKKIRFFSYYNLQIGSRYYKIKNSKSLLFYESQYSSKKKYQGKINLKKNSFLIFGQIRRYKNIHNFLTNNFKFLLNNCHLNFYIIGNAYDKIYFKEILDLIKQYKFSNVEIHNCYVNSSEISDFISKFDFVLNPSLKNYNSGVLSHCIPLSVPYLAKKQYGIEERMNQNINYLYKNLNDTYLEKILNIDIKKNDLYIQNYPQSKDFFNYMKTQSL